MALLSYKLIGDSLSVDVVSELLRYLLFDQTDLGQRLGRGETCTTLRCTMAEALKASQAPSPAFKVKERSAHLGSDPKMCELKNQTRHQLRSVE
eukprot:Skav208648  [mRNA]  locus=scaffold1081:272280:277450:- [translate_table: standard]